MPEASFSSGGEAVLLQNKTQGLKPLMILRCWRHDQGRALIQKQAFFRRLKTLFPFTSRCRRRVFPQALKPCPFKKDAGAEAPHDFAMLAARPRSCPDTKAGIFPQAENVMPLHFSMPEASLFAGGEAVVLRNFAGPKGPWQGVPFHRPKGRCFYRRAACAAP